MDCASPTGEAGGGTSHYGLCELGRFRGKKM